MTVPHSPKGNRTGTPQRKHQRRSVPQPQSTYGDECSAGRHDHRNSNKIPTRRTGGSRHLSAVWLGLAHGTRCSNSHHLRTWAGHCIATAKGRPVACNFAAACRRAALNLDSTGAHAGLRVTRRSFHPESSVGSRLNPRLANDDDSARLRAITTRSSRRSAVRVARHRTIS